MYGARSGRSGHLDGSGSGAVLVVAVLNGRKVCNAESIDRRMVRDAPDGLILIDDALREEPVYDRFEVGSS